MHRQHLWTVGEGGLGTMGSVLTMHSCLTPFWGPQLVQCNTGIHQGCIIMVTLVTRCQPHHKFGSHIWLGQRPNQPASQPNMILTLDSLIKKVYKVKQYGITVSEPKTNNYNALNIPNEAV